MKTFGEYLNESYTWKNVSDEETANKMWWNTTERTRSKNKQEYFRGRFNLKSMKYNSEYILFEPDSYQVKEFGKDCMQAYSEKNDAYFMIKIDKNKKCIYILNDDAYVDGNIRWGHAQKPQYMYLIEK